MAAIDTTMMEFSFLTSGPSFSFQIPTILAGVPELSSPIISGVGARSFVFMPQPWAATLAQGLGRDGQLLSTLTDRDGRPVELYRRIELPLVWWLRWDLSSGILGTHLREVDGIDRAQIVVDNLSIVETGPTPFLLLHAPLIRAVESTPGYQEFASTRSADDEVVMTFLRPGFLSYGQVMSSQAGGRTLLRAGANYGLEVQVSAGTANEANDVLTLVLNTLT